MQPQSQKAFLGAVVTDFVPIAIVEGVCITFVQTRQFGLLVPCKSNK